MNSRIYKNIYKNSSTFWPDETVQGLKLYEGILFSAKYL